uniref:Uncharacterized protein n=1 Tax=Anopheles farauti TaxID=69004 RepID=A0A182Q0U1_9DIPT
MVDGCGHRHQRIDLLRVALVRVGVPERYRVRLVTARHRFLVADGPVEVAPVVVRPDVGEVDERIDRQGDPKRFALPRKRGDLLAGDLQRANVLRKREEKQIASTGRLGEVPLWNQHSPTTVTLLAGVRYTHCTVSFITKMPWLSYRCTSPFLTLNSSKRPSGLHWTPVRLTFFSSLPQMRFPSTEPTMTVPSSYTMQIFCPSAVHAMPFTTMKHNYTTTMTMSTVNADDENERMLRAWDALGSASSQLTVSLDILGGEEAVEEGSIAFLPVRKETGSQSGAPKRTKGSGHGTDSRWQRKSRTEQKEKQRIASIVTPAVPFDVRGGGEQCVPTRPKTPA